eukprot:9730438-Ditylum_brightwellii.AAC.1
MEVMELGNVINQDAGGVIKCFKWIWRALVMLFHLRALHTNHPGMNCDVFWRKKKCDNSQSRQNCKAIVPDLENSC